MSVKFDPEPGTRFLLPEELGGGECTPTEVRECSAGAVARVSIPIERNGQTRLMELQLDYDLLKVLLPEPPLYSIILVTSGESDIGTVYRRHLRGWDLPDIRLDCPRTWVELHKSLPKNGVIRILYEL